MDNTERRAIQILYSISRPRYQFDKWSKEEEAVLEYLVHFVGKKWKVIEQRWPSGIQLRTSEECRHRWARICKQRSKKEKREKL